MHFRSIRGGGRRGLRDGQQVSFVVANSDKGPQAEDVKPSTHPARELDRQTIGARRVIHTNPAPPGNTAAAHAISRQGLTLSKSKSKNHPAPVSWRRYAHRFAPRDSPGQARGQLPVHPRQQVVEVSCLLMDYLKQNRPEHARTVIDVGCGWGAAGIWCAKNWDRRSPPSTQIPMYSLSWTSPRR